MKISPVGFAPIFKTRTINKQNNQKNNNITEPVRAKYLPGYAVPAFTGGKSMDLNLTLKQIDTYGNFPPDIRSDIETVLEAGNPDNKTLINIHKEKYELLNDCETLEEAKELYPEFEGVISDGEADFGKHSFVDEVKEGTVPGFDPDIDVALQLLQLYWGEGFSLTTLKEDYAGKNIHGVFEKLNIPLVDRIYGRYLKLSDKDYNERYTSEMSQRAAEIERKRVESKEGVYIPRKPLTDEHKAKISAALREYYANNPDKVLEMSERQSKYYEDNPAEKERLSVMMIRAWNYPEAKPVRKKLSKFFKQNDITESDIRFSLEPDSVQNKTLKDFWNRQPWAKKVISGCIKKSKVRQDELTKKGMIYDPVYKTSLFPKGINKIIIDALKPEFPNIEKLMFWEVPDKRDFDFDTYESKYDVPDEERLNASNAITRLFYERPEISKKLADSLQLGIMRALTSMGNQYYSSKGFVHPAFKDINDYWHQKVNEFCNDDNCVSVNDMKMIFSDLIVYCCLRGDVKAARELDKNADEAYDKIKNLRPNEIATVTKSLSMSYNQTDMLIKRYM